MSTINPFDLLRNYEQRVLQAPTSPIVLDEASDKWIGVGFRIGGNRLIAAMSDIKEIFELPVFTTVPGVKSWVIGVANVRGSLLPIIDLKGYILDKDIIKRHKGRVLVITYKGFHTGLLVEEIYGMRHFLEADEVNEENPDLDGTIKPYIEKNYRQGDEFWPVFSFEKMIHDDRFGQASL